MGYEKKDFKLSESWKSEVKHVHIRRLIEDYLQANNLADKIMSLNDLVTNVKSSDFPKSKQNYVARCDYQMLQFRVQEYLEEQSKKQKPSIEHRIRISFRFGKFTSKSFYPGIELVLYSAVVPRIGETVNFGDSIPARCFIPEEAEKEFYDDQLHMQEWIVNDVSWEMGVLSAWISEYGDMEHWDDMRHLANVELVSKSYYDKINKP